MERKEGKNDLCLLRWLAPTSKLHRERNDPFSRWALLAHSGFARLVKATKTCKLHEGVVPWRNMPPLTQAPTPTPHPSISASGLVRSACAKGPSG